MTEIENALSTLRTMQQRIAAAIHALEAVRGGIAVTEPQAEVEAPKPAKAPVKKPRVMAGPQPSKQDEAMRLLDSRAMTRKLWQQAIHGMNIARFGGVHTIVNTLLNAGLVSEDQHGVCRLTQHGRARLGLHAPVPAPEPAKPVLPPVNGIAGHIVAAIRGGRTSVDGLLTYPPLIDVSHEAISDKLAVLRKHGVVRDGEAGLEVVR